jgi:hypothetical protein
MLAIIMIVKIEMCVYSPLQIASNVHKDQQLELYKQLSKLHIYLLLKLFFKFHFFV